MLKEFINLIFTAITTMEMDKYKVRIFSYHRSDSFGAENIAYDIKEYLKHKAIEYSCKKEEGTYLTEIKYWFTLDGKKCYITIQYTK